MNTHKTDIFFEAEENMKLMVQDQLRQYFLKKLTRIEKQSKKDTKKISSNKKILDLTLSAVVAGATIGSASGTIAGAFIGGVGAIAAAPAGAIIGGVTGGAITFGVLSAKNNYQKWTNKRTEHAGIIIKASTNLINNLKNNDFFSNQEKEWELLASLRDEEKIKIIRELFKKYIKLTMKNATEIVTFDLNQSPRFSHLFSQEIENEEKSNENQYEWEVSL